MAKKAIEIESGEREEIVRKPNAYNDLCDLCKRHNVKMGVTSRDDGSKSIIIHIPANG